MKKILFISKTNDNSNYFRIIAPLIGLKKQYPDSYNYDFQMGLDYSKEEERLKLFDFDIIVYKTTLLSTLSDNNKLLLELKEKDIKLYLDIDEYWELPKNHPSFDQAFNKLNKELVVDNIREATLVTTPNLNLCATIKAYNKNVHIVEDAVLGEYLPQFKNNWYPDSKVRITYHGDQNDLGNLQLLDGTFNLLLSDNSIKDKFVIVNAGFDKRGKKFKRKLNESFFKMLDLLRIPQMEVIKSLVENNFDLDKVTLIPDDLKLPYKDNFVTFEEVDIEPKESPHYKYEKILTDNYKRIDTQYNNFLHRFENSRYPNEVNYYRKWIKPSTEYAKFLDETDILLAPLSNNTYNNLKSNLKMVEAMSRNIPVICSNVSPYTKEGKDMQNCILIDNKKNEFRDWYKAIKKLILSEELRKELGINLSNDLQEKHSLKKATTKRMELFNSLC